VVLKKQGGQTAVEYILLLAVATSLVMTFFRSDLYKKYFGTRGTFGTAIKRNNEFAYRHAYPGKASTADVSATTRDITSHPSYYDPERSGTRFFGGKEPYP
jgi:hypothetical protein